jgi:hypothetical protein
VSQWADAGDDVRVFVDWNGDLDFTDGGEALSLVEGALLPNGSVQYTGTLLAPPGTLADPRMRVVLAYGTPSACQFGSPSSIGNVEDYGVGGGGQAMVLNWTDARFGTIGFQISNGQANGTYVLIITGNGANYPNGWFFGIAPTFQEIMEQVAAGFPFVGPLTAAGSATFGPVGGAPSGLTIYGVAFSTPGGVTTGVTKVSAPDAHTVL